MFFVRGGDMVSMSVFHFKFVKIILTLVKSNVITF